MDGCYRADLPALDRLVERMARVERRAGVVLADLDTRVAALGEEWSGVAAEDCRAAHRRWSADAAQLRTALSELRGVLATAHANYAAAVTAGRTMWT